MGKTNKKNSNAKKLLIIAGASIVVIVAAFSIKVPDSSTNATANSAKKVKDSDIVIPISEINEIARYYPASIDGIELEVLAVKSPDGTIRTAFNTCQICYSSGRGYYIQDGDALICQNCGNRFALNDVEVTRGGCNPVPITEEYKTIDDETITVSKDFLSQATVIFKNWR